MMPVMADPTQLEVAVLNLAINARDAMPDGGVLSFSSRPVRVSGDPEIEDGDYIELTISDTGVGMPPEVAERAFEPFFTTKEVGKGTGLGLSMVYGMARQSGGGARIESAPGKGTAVKLLFRKADKRGGRGRRAGPDEAAARPGHDRAIGAGDRRRPRRPRLHRRDAGGAGISRSARRATGARASSRSHAKRPDLVVLDFIMPGLSGAEVASRIRAKQPDQPILFVSGYSETERSSAPRPTRRC